MKVWITKWALSEGIVEREAQATHVNGMIGIIGDSGYMTYLHNEGTHWHRSHADAVIRADAMRLKKIASLKQQIKRLENLSFTAPAAPAEAAQ